MDRDAQSDVSRLTATVGRFGDWGFVVLDGGLFGDLPALLRQERLFARSLFLDHVDQDVEKAGPWLVTLAQHPEAASRIAGIVGNKPAAAYWLCRSGEAPLWRHLRTLNVAKIPTWAAMRRDGPSDAYPPDVLEGVMFRHWDPRVLGALLPVLDAPQFSRLLGPAEEIAFLSTDFGGVRRAVKDSDWPPTPPGMLAIRSEQIAAMGTRRQTASDKRMRDYLRQTAPEQTSSLDDAQLQVLVERYRASGSRMGLDHERSLSIWGFLMISSNDRFERLPNVRKYLTTGAGDPNDKVETLLDAMARLAATKREVG